MPSAGDINRNEAADALTLAIDKIMSAHALGRVLSEFPVSEQARLEHELDGLARRLEALIEASTKSQQSLDLDVLLTRLVTLISDALDAERASLFLYDNETHELYSRIAQGDLVDEIRFNADLGIAGSAYRTNEYLIIDDAYNDSRFNKSVDEETGYVTKRILAVPVRNRAGQVIGVGEVLNRRDGPFSHADAAVIQAFTTHIAGAIENAQLSERQRINAHEESRFHEVSQAISSELDIDVLLKKIMSIATELLDAERSTLFLYDPRTNELWSRVAEGIDEKEIRFPANAGIAGEVFSTQKSVNIPDAYADPRFNQSVDKMTGFKTSTILCVPVISRQGNTLGVVQVLNHKGGPFRQRDEKRLEMLASQSAIALDNARLFSEVLSERNYSNNVLRSLSNGVLTVDVHGNLVKINDAGTKILGRNADDVLGAPVEKVFRGQNNWVTKVIDTVLSTRETSTALDTALENSRQQSITVNLSATPLLDARGHSLGCTVVIEDISSEKRIRTTMARYMTREVADQVLAEGKDVLGGQAQPATVMFADIADFTGLTEALGATGTVNTLNEYFTEMVEVIFEHHGTLDKYIGDAIMAVFGAPFPSPEDADNAVATAISMHERLAIFNRLRSAVNKPPINIRIGINSDQVVTGNIGSERRMDYTVIGDGVNVAARLEQANKQFGTQTLISAATVKLLHQDYHLRELDLLRIRGKSQPVPIFEVIGKFDNPLSAEKQAMLEHFRNGMESYRQRDWIRAVGEFGMALRVDPQDTPSQIFCSRTSHYLQNPPSEDWDGVWSE
ncbi:MAG: GAF domain-containing protein [Pseudomonadota bacterium]